MSVILLSVILIVVKLNFILLRGYQLNIILQSGIILFTVILLKVILQCLIIGGMYDCTECHSDDCCCA
jgi:hypothetical protein